MSCLTHHVRSRNEATHPRLPASLCEVLRSLLHLLGLRLFRGAGAVSQGHPHFIASKQVLRGTISLSCLKRACPGWGPRRERPACPLGGAESWVRSPPASQQAPAPVSRDPWSPGLCLSQWLTDLAPLGGGGAPAEKPVTCPLPAALEGVACASVCVAECVTRVCGREEGAWCLLLHLPVSSPISCPFLCIERPVQRSSL